MRDADPLIAVTEAWDPKHYDEILISTLPMKFSKWMHAGLPERVSKLTGALVTHVVSQPPRPVAAAAPAPSTRTAASCWARCRCCGGARGMI